MGSIINKYFIYSIVFTSICPTTYWTCCSFLPKTTLRVFLDLTSPTALTTPATLYRYLVFMAWLVSVPALMQCTALLLYHNIMVSASPDLLCARMSRARLLTLRGQRGIQIW